MIDRVTKFAFVELHEKATRRIAADALHALFKAVLCAIHTVLTDNGTHFTSPGNICSGAAHIRCSMNQATRSSHMPSNKHTPRTASITG